MPGDEVAIVAPDYFANRKLVEFFGATPVPITLHYETRQVYLDLEELENAFTNGAKTFIFSNPNNPTGVVYPVQQLQAIADLTEKYDVTVIADQLYSRQIFTGVEYTHLLNLPGMSERTITIMGPSKTESLSGFRLGVAIAPEYLIQRMEKVQALTTLRAGGYNQAVFDSWFAEGDDWIQSRIEAHQAIRDDLVAVIQQAGASIVFVKLLGLVGLVEIRRRYRL